MKSKVAVTCFLIALMILTFTSQIPATFALEEEYLGCAYTEEYKYYGGHVVSKGFGVDISIYSPVEKGVPSFTKTAFAVPLGESWSTGSGTTLTYWRPYVGKMWVKVQGNSYYWPTENTIVNNIGTGGECLDAWMALLNILEIVLPEILKSLFSTPPLKEWDENAHWVKAIVRDGPFVSGRLRTGAANFYSLFELAGYNTLSVTAEAEICVEYERPFAPGGAGKGYYYVGKYSVDFPVSIYVYGGGGGSCPFVYSWDAQEYHFDHEAYPFAVMKSAETTSYDRLKYLKEVDGEYKLKIEQVLHEIDWTDSFELYAVDHPDESSFVMPDLQGNLHTVKELTQPISAYEKNGDDCLEDVKYLDDKIWKDSIFDADVNDESTLRNWIVLTFPKPEGTTEAKLMLSVKKQITITQEWEFFISVIGENFWTLWQKIMENPILTELYLDMYEREISLRIEVWNGTEWVLQDSISAGDALWDDFLAVLDIFDVEGDELQIRLKSTTAHYEINYAGIDYSEDEPMIVNKVDPYYAVKNGEEDISVALESPDENYVTLLPNDVIELRYEAIPESEWKRDFTIATKGYYNFVDFQDQTFPGFLEGITLWLKGLTEPYFVAKTVFPYLQQMGE